MIRTLAANADILTLTCRAKGMNHKIKNSLMNKIGARGTSGVIKSVALNRGIKRGLEIKGLSLEKADSVGSAIDNLPSQGCIKH